jgi:splicing factor U2AF subunit
VKELISTFGELKAFNLIKTGAGSTQTAIVEYTDAALTDAAIAGLNMLDIAGYKLQSTRVPAAQAALLIQPVAPSKPPAPPAPVPEARDPLEDMLPTSVIRLSNMTTPEDLDDDELYLELREDIVDECSKYGEVKTLQIPRGIKHGGDSADEVAVGNIYVQFGSAEEAARAREAVAGRSFNGLIVKAVFYPETPFSNKVSTS